MGMLGLLALALVASTTWLAGAAAAQDLPGAPPAGRPAPHAPLQSGDVWIGQSPRYGIRIVVLSGVALDLDSVDALVEAVIPSAGGGPALGEEIEIGIIPHVQLQKIAAALGVPEEVLFIRRGPQILLTEQLLASPPGLTQALAVHLFHALQERNGPIQQVQLPR